jgi:hypothetical protein
LSHYVCLALLPAAPGPDVQRVLEGLLARYDENREVPEYERECDCASRLAVDTARAHAELMTGETLWGLRQKFDACYAEDVARLKAMDAWDQELVDTMDERWQEFTSAFRGIGQAKLESLKPWPDDPTCRACGGTGKEKTTYPPEAKWDWWVIGGRWDRLLPGEANACPVEALIQHNDTAAYNDRFLPYAMLGPDGTWYARGRMGSFGMSSDEYDRKAWAGEVRAILARHPGHWAVLLDLHI